MSRFELEQALRLLQSSNDPSDRARVRKVQKALERLGGAKDTLLTERTYESPEKVAEALPRDESLPMVPGSDEARRESRLKAGREESEKRFKKSLMNIRSPSWLEQLTAPPTAELVGGAIADAALIPAMLGKYTRFPPLAATAALLPAQGVMSGAFHKASKALPWNKRWRDDEEGVGTLSGEINPLKSQFWLGGTGALGAAERAMKFAGPSYFAGPAAGRFANKVRRTTLGLKPGKYEFDPTSPFFASRKSLSDEHKEAIDALISRYKELGLEPPSYRAATRMTLAGIPAIAKAPVFGYHVAKQIRDTIGSARDFYLRKLINMSPTVNRSDVSENMFEAAVNFTERQVQGYRNLYKLAYDFAEKGGPMRVGDKVVNWKGLGKEAVFDVSPVLAVADDILGKGKALSPMLPETVRNWIKTDVKNMPRNMDIRAFREAHDVVENQLRNMFPADDGFRELQQIENAFKSVLKRFYRSADDVYGTSIGLNIRTKFDMADEAFKGFQEILKTPAAAKFRRAEKAFGQPRHADPASGQRYTLGSTSIDIDKLFGVAMRDPSPRYLNTLRTILDFENNPAAWKGAVATYLDEALAMSSRVGEGASIPVFNRAAFYKKTGLDQGDGMLKELLKGTDMTPKQVKAFADVLHDYPVTPDIQQMLVRRMALGGPKTLLTLGAGSALGGSFLDLDMSMVATAIALIYGVRLGTRALASPKMIKALTDLGKTEKNILRSKTASVMVPRQLVQVYRIMLELEGHKKEAIDREVKKLVLSTERGWRDYERAVGGDMFTPTRFKAAVSR